jgi:hypothetical protein
VWATAQELKHHGLSAYWWLGFFRVCRSIYTYLTKKKTGASGVTWPGPSPRRSLRHCPGKTRHALVWVPPTPDAGCCFPLRCPISWIAIFTPPSPSTRIQIFHRMRRSGGDETIGVRSDPRLRCFCVNTTFFLSGTHARTHVLGARNRGPGGGRSRGRGLRADVAMLAQP